MAEDMDSTWVDDADHPIPWIGKLDALAKFPDGRRNLGVVIASPLDESQYSQSRLLNKIQNYVQYLKSPEYESEFGKPTSNLVSLTVKIHNDSSESIFALLEKCESWVRDSGATLQIERL
jgi:hypothetical protein